MQSLWDEREAARYSDDLGQRIYSSHLLGSDRSLVLPGCGSVSLKARYKNIYVEDEDILCVSARGQNLATIEESGFSLLRLSPVRRLATLESIDDGKLADELRLHLASVSAPPPPLGAVLHAVLPYKYVDHTYADAVLSVANTPSGLERMKEIFDAQAIVLPYSRIGLSLARACADGLSPGTGNDIIGIVFMQQGIVSFGETAKVSYEHMIELVSRVEAYLEDRGVWQITVPDIGPTSEPDHGELAALRKSISDAAGFPVVMTTYYDPQCLSFARHSDIPSIARQPPPTPVYARHTGYVPLLGRDVPGYCAMYERDLADYAARSKEPLALQVPAPRVILDPELGMCAIGRTAARAAATGGVYRHLIDTILRASELERYQPLPAQEGYDTEFSQINVAEEDTPLPFTGEVALVTGAASGIGRACVESFLARGAAVVGLDINPSIMQLFDRCDFLGLECDVTNEDAIRRALRTTVRAYGGLDMLVLNAGIFLPGCHITSLGLAEWERIMRVNLDANLIILRETHPLLKLAPRRGRVVINGSKNYLAPGPGAAPYSSSKAALVQLGRVAALEWAADGIRINMVHPDAVFDTAIWTEELLRARAENYGLTVEEYKRNNLLKVEITSHDVGEMIAEMCGPLFDKTTGAQVPIDGGNIRII